MPTGRTHYRKSVSTTCTPAVGVTPIRQSSPTTDTQKQVKDDYYPPDSVVGRTNAAASLPSFHQGEKRRVGDYCAVFFPISTLDSVDKFSRNLV
jgi:hypothetical protein